MPVPISPAKEITPPSDEWVKIDLGKHLVEGDHDPHLGFFELRNPTDDWEREAGLRPPGSSWNTRSKTWNGVGHFRYCPTRNRAVEAYVSSQVELWYHGYVDRRRGGSFQQARRLPRDEYGSWFTVDATRVVNTDHTPEMVFIRWVRSDQWGFSRIGSKHPRQQENMIGRTYEMIHGSFAFCDSNGRFQLYVQDGDTYPFITGWVDSRASAAERQRLINPSMGGQWATTDLSGSRYNIPNHNDIVWLFTGNRHWYATEDERVRVAHRQPGSGVENYDAAGLVQWRPVHLSGHKLQQKIEQIGASSVHGGGTWLLGRTAPMRIDRDDPGSPGDPPPPSDPKEEMGPLGFVRADYDGDKVDIPVFGTEHVDGSCLRVGLPDGQVGAFALAPRTEAEWPRFSFQTESGVYGIDTIDVDWREPAEHAPVVRTGDIEFLE